MPLHNIFDIIVDCDVLIPELSLVAAGRPEIRISSGDQTSLDITAVRWIHEWKDEKGETTIAYGSHREDHILAFPAGGDFLISFSNNRIHYFAHPDVPMVTIQHLLLDQVLPRYLAHQGHLVLHASAIRLPDGRGIVFSGPSGAGKSTLAASFIGHGAHLLADDCLLLRMSDANVMGVASYRGLRLYDDSRRATLGMSMESSDVAHYSSKRRIRIDLVKTDEGTSCVPIDAIFILQDNEVDNVQISPVKGVKPAMDLLGQLFMLDVTRGTNAEMGTLRAVANLLSGTTVTYNIDYPWHYSYLKKVRERILFEIG